MKVNKRQYNAHQGKRLRACKPLAPLPEVKLEKDYVRHEYATACKEGEAVKTEAVESFTFPFNVSKQRVKDLLCSACEGGSNYWIDRVEYWHECPVYDQPVIFHLSNARDIDGLPKTLDGQALVRGLTVMARDYPKHFGDFIAENDDAITADVFLQCCLFGDVIYG